MTAGAMDHDLLREFNRKHTEEAFTALVDRYMGLVYSAALRQVRSPQLAEEVAQAVFTSLALNAPKLRRDGVLTAWLYQVTRNAAVDVVRREARRQAREQIAWQMSETNSPSSDWIRIEPLLEEGMQALDETDRTALLLRYFENKSLREVGQALGTNEDAAQKRVSRAVERLRDFFSERKVAIGASGLAALVSANAIQAAPAGLVAAVATHALRASTTVSATTAITVSKTIAMTTIQKTIIGVAVTAAVVGGFYQARQVAHLRHQVQALQQQAEERAALSTQVQALRRELDRATNRVAALSAEKEKANRSPNEVLKLRGEVGRLRQENFSLGSSNALSKVTANPEARKLLRDQQKLGMSMIYKGFAQRAKLTSDQTDKLNDLLADHIMENVGHVTTLLRDKLALPEADRLFAAQDAVVQGKIQALLGDDGLAKYQDYTKNLLSTLTAEQFKNMLTGDDPVKETKSKQMAQAVQEAVQAALSNAGLPAEYQTIPMLNFRNIANEQAGDQSLKLLDDIYQRAAAQAASFLSPEELAKFQQFKATAINNNRGALMVNRTLMAPISD